MCYPGFATLIAKVAQEFNSVNETVIGIILYAMVLAPIPQSFGMFQIKSAKNLTMGKQSGRQMPRWNKDKRLVLPLNLD